MCYHVNPGSDIKGNTWHQLIGGLKDEGNNIDCTDQELIQLIYLESYFIGNRLRPFLQSHYQMAEKVEYLTNICDPFTEQI